MIAHRRQRHLFLTLLFSAAIVLSLGMGQTLQQRQRGGGTDPVWQVTFNVAPQGAKAAGGRWERIVETEPGIKFPSEYKFGDQFLTSDSVKLNPLHHFRVTFHPIPNWGTPDPVDFQVERDGLTVTGQYRTMSGTLVVTIQPAEVASAGARWAVNSMDAPWRRSGESAGIVVGTYDLLFDRYDASRWNPPSHTTLRINPNTTTNFTATFTRK